MNDTVKPSNKSDEIERVLPTDNEPDIDDLKETARGEAVTRQHQIKQGELSQAQMDELFVENEKGDPDLINDDIANYREADIENILENDPGMANAVGKEELVQADVSDSKEQVQQNQLPDDSIETSEKMRDMSTDQSLQNSIHSAQTEVAKDIQAEVKQELPDSLKKQYLVDETQGKFFDKGNQSLAFEDKGKQIDTRKNDAQTIDSMMTLAKSKGWKSIELSGDKDFKREAWLQASMSGIAVRGYSPNKDDKSLLNARIEAQQKNTMTQSKEQDASRVNSISAAIIKDKVQNPATQAKIIAEVNRRAGDAIEHGKSPQFAVYDEKATSKNAPAQVQTREDKERTR